MDLGSIFLLLAILILVILFVGRPLLESPRQPSAYGSRASVRLAENQEHQLSALLAERDRILNALQELDFDYAMGKIPEVDYPAQRAFLVKRGAEVLRGLDALQGARQAMAASPAQREDVEARLEAEIAFRRDQTQRASRAHLPEGRQSRSYNPDDALEVEIALRRRARQEKAAGFCPQCGGPVQRSDLFCPKCGERLKNNVER